MNSNSEDSFNIGKDLSLHLTELANRAELATNIVLVHSVLKCVHSVWRKFMISSGLMNKRNKDTLTGKALVNYRATNLAISKRFYSKNRLQVLAKRKEKRDLEKLEKQSKESNSNLKTLIKRKEKIR